MRSPSTSRIRRIEEGSGRGAGPRVEAARDGDRLAEAEPAPDREVVDARLVDATEEVDLLGALDEGHVDLRVADVAALLEDALQFARQAGGRPAGGGQAAQEGEVDLAIGPDPDLAGEGAGLRDHDLDQGARPEAIGARADARRGVALEDRGRERGRLREHDGPGRDGRAPVILRRRGVGGLAAREGSQTS